MKKHLIITISLFAVITILALLANFIKWDETPLEQSLAMLPLGIGFSLEMPFLTIVGLSIGGADVSVNYTLLWTIIPFISGGFYAGLYLLIIYLIRIISKS